MTHSAAHSPPHCQTHCQPQCGTQCDPLCRREEKRILTRRHLSNQTHLGTVPKKLLFTHLENETYVKQRARTKKIIRRRK